MFFLQVWILGVAGLGYDVIGIINPEGELAVSNSITNAGFAADFTFTFSTAHDIPAGGVLAITFPSQFNSNLGIAGDPICSTGSCTLSGYTVSLVFSQSISAGKVTSVVIYGLQNPNNSGGVGNFQLVSKYSDYVIDMNLVFATLGISVKPSLMTLVTIGVLEGSSDIAGDITKYLFTFQSNQIIPAGSWLKFYFPDDGLYIPENPSCSSYATTGKNIVGDLQCVTTTLTVTLTGISEDLVAGSQYNVRMTGTNTNWSASLGKFNMYVFRENTNTLFLYKENILGFEIYPSSFLEVDFGLVDDSLEISRNRIMLYRLSIRVKNPIEASGYIIINYPSTFSMDGDYLYWVESGLEDFSYLSTVQISYSIPLLTLTISNFAAVAAETYISIIMQLKTPNLSGVSSNLLISTLRPDMSTVIDQSDSQANTTVTTRTSPTITVTYTGSALAGGTSITINFLIVPNIAVPAEGYVKFKFPSDFGTGSLVCTITPYGSGTDFAKSCTVSSSVVSAQLFISTLNSPSGPGDFQQGQSSTVTLQLTSPLSSGYYFFSLRTYDSTSTLLETGGVMVKIDASAFASTVIKTISNGVDSPTVLKFLLTSNYIIPSGVAQEDTLLTRGYFDIELPTQANGNSLFDLDLGLGLNQNDELPCRGISVISGVDDNGLTCIVTSRPTVASIGTPVIITVSGFNELPASASFEFHLAGPFYFLTANAGDVIITAYSITNRITTNIHISSYTLIAAIASPAATIAAGAISLSTTTAQALTSMSFTFTTVAIGAANSFLLLKITPTHDAGYCTYIDISCTSSSTFTCYCYPGADMILIFLPSGLITATYTFTIENLVNPQSVSSTADGLNLYVIDNFVLKKYFQLGSFPLITSGSITDAVFNIDQTCAGCVNVMYEFYLRCSHSIPENGSIVITLDPTMSYSLHYSSPKPYCSYFSDNGIEIISYTCTPYRNILTLSDLPRITQGTLLRVLLVGVKHPSSLGSIGLTTFQSLNEYSRVIDSASLNGPSLTSYLEVKSVTDAVISNYPSNAGATAEYIVFFTPIASIAPGALIEIDFPTKNFDQFINPPDCRIAIGILFIKDCYFEGKTFQATVNSDYHNSQITVHILGIINFAKGTSDSFAIRVKYDGVTLQQSTTSIKVSTTKAASSINTNFLNFYPKNEGETCTFEFHITPSKDIDTSSYLTIVFPRTFDKRIGDTFDCWAAGLNGFIKCQLVNSWTLQVIDGDYYTACSGCSITLFVFGVVNPNYSLSSNSGEFIVGVLQSNSYTQLNENSGELSMNLAPGFLNLYETTVNNFDSRTDNSFTFNFTTSVSIPSSSNSGAIWVEFPDDYVLEGSVISCTSSIAWANGTPDCEIKYQVVKIYPSTSAYAGELIITINGLCNPLSEVLAGFINIKVYDGFNQVILIRSYSNLSKNQITYMYPGPAIRVNQDKTFTAERGTLSEFIKISLDYPCSLNLTLIPYTFGFVFIPTQISLQTGMMETVFRVSVPSNIDDTLYVINWEIVGEANPIYYTPINKSLFLITKLKNVQVTFSNIPDIPKGGQSIPIKVELTYSPYDNINLLFSLSTVYSGLSMLPKKMEFHTGDTIGYYRIFVSNTTEASNSQITVSLLGTDSEVFSLSKSTLNFNLYSNDTVLPDVTSIAITKIYRSTANIVITTNKAAIVYYAYAGFGTVPPSFTELQQGGPPSYNTSGIQYGTIYIDSSFVANITLVSLSAAKSYTIFAIAEDQLLQMCLVMRTANFTTLPLNSAAIINMWFTKTYLTSVETEIAMNAVALVTGLNPWQVLEVTATSRRLDSQTDSVVTLLQLYLIDNPQSDDYPTPKLLIPLLKSQIPYLASSLNYFDASSGITGQEVVLSECSYYSSPMLLGTTDYKSISLSASLVEAGYLYGVAVPSDQDYGKPLNYQVASGLDSANRVASFAWKNMKLKTAGTLTFTDLAADSNYNVYVVCGNLMPGYPSLSQNVSLINWKTDLAPAPDLLSVSGGTWLISSLFIVYF